MILITEFKLHLRYNIQPPLYTATTGTSCCIACSIVGLKNTTLPVPITSHAPVPDPDTVQKNLMMADNYKHSAINRHT